ncbi:unnamed protein product [Cuscuta campestris]|uniref:Uncharacterized protein n=1 Tax=Cuscuta campestris TaxID=132261 RepID=A0A484L163_9ASTE|nr:unnamed protein product [Cuscuta campestris]
MNAARVAIGDDCAQYDFQFSNLLPFCPPPIFINDDSSFRFYLQLKSFYRDALMLPLCVQFFPNLLNATWNPQRDNASMSLNFSSNDINSMPTGDIALANHHPPNSSTAPRIGFSTQLFKAASAMVTVAFKYLVMKAQEYGLTRPFAVTDSLFVSLLKKEYDNYLGKRKTIAEAALNSSVLKPILGAVQELGGEDQSPHKTILSMSTDLTAKGDGQTGSVQGAKNA